MCEKYNGWQNKPTWLVNVWGWLDNPEQYEDLIKQAVDDTMKSEKTLSAPLPNRISVIYFRLGEMLEEYVRDALEQNKGCGYYHPINDNRLSQSTEASNGFEQDLINWKIGRASCRERV